MYTYQKGSRHDFMVGIYLMDKKHFNPDDLDVHVNQDDILFTRAQKKQLKDKHEEDKTGINYPKTHK